MNCFGASAFHFAEPAKLPTIDSGASTWSNRPQRPAVNPSLIFFVKMAAFAVCTQSRFGGGHDDIAGLIGCGVNA
jgi:hypothetical protein